MVEKEVRMQVCKACDENKSITEYHWRKDTKSNGGYRYVCKECACKRAKESYQRNKESAKARCAKAAKTRILERRKYVYNYLKSHSCIECGEDDPRCLDFDHIDQEDKDLAISRAIWNNWSMDRLINEINKCRILCSNCHRKRTADQLGWYKFDDDSKESLSSNKKYIFDGDKSPIVTKEELLRNHLKYGKEYIETMYLQSIKDSIKHYVENNGWFYPPRISPIEELEKSVHSIIKNSNFDYMNEEFSSMTTDGVSYLKGLFRSYWNVNGGPVKSFYDDKILDRVLKYRLGINNSKDYKYQLDGKEVFYNELFDITLANIRRGFVVQRNAVSFFKPRVACEIYNKFLKDIENPKVYDPSAGFGARMLGFASYLKASNKKGLYVGSEPAKQTHSDLLSLANEIEMIYPEMMDNKLVRYGSEYKIKEIKSKSIDLVFTSPPYFDKEKYFDEHTQCWKKYPNLELWKKNYLLPTFENAYSYLKDDGVLVINISENLVNAVAECALSAGFDFKYRMKLSIGRDHFSKKTGLSYEPILVYSKIID